MSILIMGEVPAPDLYFALKTKIISGDVAVLVTVFIPHHLNSKPFFVHSDSVELGDGIKKTIAKKATEYLDRQAIAYAKNPEKYKKQINGYEEA